jgi:hypothetical protein
MRSVGQLRVNRRRRASTYRQGGTAKALRLRITD